MKQFRNILYLLSITLLAACEPRLYFPDRVNAPGFKEAKEFKATISGKPQSGDTVSGKTPGAALSPAIDLAYSVTDHFAVIASYRDELNNYIYEQKITGNQGLGHHNTFGGQFNGNYLEGGAGYFTPYDNHGRLEVFAGYGAGSMARTSLFTPQFDYSANYHRFFLQPALGYYNDIFSLMGGFKFIFQKYGSFQSGNSDLKYLITTPDGYVSGTDVTSQLFVFVQPFVNMDIGYKYVRFDIQMGYSAETVGGYISGSFPVYITLGATFNYAPRFFKKRPERVIYNKEN